MAKIAPLTPERLAARTDPDGLGFSTTDDLADIEETIGQARAVEAARFGVGIRRDGYNLFALGPPGIGKHTMMHQVLADQARNEPTPADQCYVHNFADPGKPNALGLPAGRARPFAGAMDRLVEELRAALPAAFESDAYRARRQAIEDQMKARHETAFGALQKKAQSRGIALMRTPMGLALTPVRDGEVLTPEQFNEQPEEEQARIKSDIEELQKELEAILRQVPQWESEMRRALRDLNREVTGFAVTHLIDDLKRSYADLPEIVEHLDAVQADVVDNAEAFMHQEGSGQIAMLGGMPVQMRQAPPDFTRYKVNVLVDHAENEGAPVVYEDHPTYQNLLGRVEHQSQFGALVTDFNMIKPGALHRANGGYLIVDARKLLNQPFAWDELKRVLRARELRIETLGQMYGLISTVTLEPEPIPLDAKIVLLGDRMLYYLLCRYDPEFSELFKVPVDFEDRMPREPAVLGDYARLIATMARQGGLRRFEAGAVAAVMDQAARLAEDSERLTTHLSSISDLLRESDYWAGQAGLTAVTAANVQTAVAAQIRRADRIRERMQEEIERGTVLVDTDGTKTGQINGLAVYQLGSFAFGRPSRISARVALGRGEVLDIEREVALGGPLHSKGVLILQGFLTARFGQERPMSLRASLVFEQSYGGVDGDSASSAELYALLSALSGLPLRQDLAVTGSVNQHGEVQAIGGVNEKVEGFFDVCAARGLTGDQGVLIPASNVKHLMLRQDVVEAARMGRFHVYPVTAIDEGIALLTGVEAGERDSQGRYPPESVNGKVEARLAELADAARSFARQDKEERAVQPASVPDTVPPEPQR
jgi:lon-related putative ATP-dependent protease